MKTSILLFAFLLVGALACKKDDPCDNITCLNGGTCANGACNCPPGYAGSDCSQRLSPESITIKTITLTTYPLVDISGGSWDFGNGADIYLSLTQGGVQIEQNIADRVENAAGSQLSWNTNFIIYQSSEQFCLSAFDRDDFDADDLMGGICFNPFDESITDDFPETVPLSCNGCTVAFSLTVDYDF